MVPNTNFGGIPLTRRLKRSSRANPREDRNYENPRGSRNNVIELDQFSTKSIKQKKVELIPKNLHQEEYIDYLENPDIDVVFAIGPAGTGKTMLATVAAIQALKAGKVDKIIITRPAVSVDEQHGFLPGTLIEKMQPWILPILDYFYEYYSKKQVMTMIEDGTIDVVPLAFMRGRTFKRSFMLLDESQNTLPSQMKMFLTRIGEGSKIVVTGDMNQHDRGFDQNGLKDFLSRLSGHRGIAVCQFGSNDIERHPIIDTILDMYED